MTISIHYDPSETDYAAKELKKFLGEFTNAILTENAPAERSVTLLTDAALPAHCYRIAGDGDALTVRGASPSAVLCGVCDALSDAGLLFLASGYSAPKGFDSDAFFRASKEVRPKFRLRGVRQHINFPMDISSYPLWEAQEYVRALARMRFNAITFHSYPGQWHAADPADPNDRPGHFFYGQVHPVADDDPLLAERLRNRRFYCIPEAEAIFEDEAARGEYARYWLNQVMKTAKDAGMELTLSVEVTTDDEEKTVRMLRAVCEAYPLIDTLELITEECGGFRSIPGLTIENLREFLTGTLGGDIVDENGEIPYFPETLPTQLGAAAESLKRILRAVENRERWLAGLPRRPALRAGLYLTEEATLKVLRCVLRKKLPEGMTMSLLPAHGALAAADNIENTGTVEADWQNTMFYSWAEFDGNMYLQQLSTDGIEKLAGLPEAESAYGMCINHWRTSENDLTIAYAAEAAVCGAGASDFYRQFAAKLGVADGELFAQTCDRLAKLDTYNRDHLFNIGFCAIGCWLDWCRGDNGETLPRGLSVPAMREADARYRELIGAYERLLPGAGTKEAAAHLRLMINRCETSILHIRSLLSLELLRDIYDYDDPKPLTREQADAVEALLKTAEDSAAEYLRLYGELLPDRGCEGQLVSYYVTTPVFVRAVAAHFRGNPAILAPDAYDAPPMPDGSVL
ncbi:MAG: hypothetical protein IK118_01535 [Clostridia bacterium]|nr:hypothetical protein [Clostridia bacterium]